MRHSEFGQAIKEILNEIKFDRKLERAIAGDGADGNKANVEDWEYRNYMDGWVPTFEKLRDKLVSWFKESKYNSQMSKDDPSEKHTIPAMLTKAVLKKAVTAMFASVFGQRPRQQILVSGTKDIKALGRCCGCGLPGHKRGDPACKAGAGTLHESAPGRAKRKINGNPWKSSDGGTTVKRANRVCQFLAETEL